jgi:glycosyltransferase involved in cell wall biosynthesis
MTSKQVTIVVTVLNEEKTIKALLKALAEQSRPFDELIITDGGSVDKTALIVSDFQMANPELNIRFIEVSGNRSVGRNTGIAESTSEIIAITDAGCVPHKDWLAELLEKYQSECVVAGYYDAKPKNGFEEAVVPYVLVMPDKVNPNTFLPATRSMLIEKTTWEKVGGFTESLNWNEDYEFAHKLIKHKVKIIFAEKAVVSWMPRQNLTQFWKMIWHFAQGDAQARIWRPKVLFLFLRYLLLLIIVGVLYLYGLIFALGIILLTGFLGYCSWAVIKNQKYVPHGKLWLPILQFTADFAVMTGTLAGLVN